MKAARAARLALQPKSSRRRFSLTRFTVQHRGGKLIANQKGGFHALDSGHRHSHFVCSQLLRWVLCRPWDAAFNKADAKAIATTYLSEAATAKPRGGVGFGGDREVLREAHANGLTDHKLQVIDARGWRSQDRLRHGKLERGAVNQTLSKRRSFTTVSG